jgi:hypothetical protein
MKTLGRILFRHIGEISFKFLERVPGEFAVGKNRGVFGLRQVKQISGFEHGDSLGQVAAMEK